MGNSVFGRISMNDSNFQYFAICLGFASSSSLMPAHSAELFITGPIKCLRGDFVWRN